MMSVSPYMQPRCAAELDVARSSIAHSEVSSGSPWLYFTHQLERPDRIILFVSRFPCVVLLPFTLIRLDDSHGSHGSHRSHDLDATTDYEYDKEDPDVVLPRLLRLANAVLNEHPDEPFNDLVCLVRRHKPCVRPWHFRVVMVIRGS